MKPTEKIFFLFLFLLLFNAIYNVSHLFLSHFNTKTPFIGKKVRFGPIVHCHFVNAKWCHPYHVTRQGPLNRDGRGS